MNKINFVNNGQPAINDTNLNNLQDNIENEFNKNIYTASGIVKLNDTLKIQYGRLSNVTVPASGLIKYTVNFLEKFTNIPMVFAMPRGNYNIICQITEGTTTSFGLNVRSVDGNERTDRSFDWMAIGI